LTKWLLRCTRCGRTWILEVSFDLTKLSTGKLYHYCPYCKQNTFHEVIKRIEDEEFTALRKVVERYVRENDEERGSEQSVRRPVSADS
jgi:DNA-directed RNA polymerase subunit RPC12/RpoP